MSARLKPLFKKAFLGLLLGISVATVASYVLDEVMLKAPPASALSGSSWQAGHIIDDGVFANNNAMTATEIQSFLNAQMPTCDTYGTQLSTHPNGSGGYYTHAQWGALNGNSAPFTCLKDFVENPTTLQNNFGNPSAVISGGQSAAQIIWNVAQKYQINPQVILVTLQKEQGLVTDTWPWYGEYKSAMGYACPDTAPCSGSYSDFYKQVDGAAWQFRYYLTHPGAYNYWIGNNKINYSPNSACGSSIVNIQNAATAALYIYTPYQPNAAALANLSGTGDSCSSYGNRNFWRDFTTWFGSTYQDFYVACNDDGTGNCASSGPQYVIYNGVKYLIPDPQTKVAWNLQNLPTTPQPSSYLSSLTSGVNLSRIYLIAGGDQGQYFVDGGNSYAIVSPQMIYAWNIQGITPIVVPRDLAALLNNAGTLSYAVQQQGSAGAIYMIDGASNGQTVLRPYSDPNVLSAWEGDQPVVTELSSDYFSQIDTHIGSTINSMQVSCNGVTNLVISQQILAESSAVNGLYPGTAQQVSGATCNRLFTNPSPVTAFIRPYDSPTVYMIDNGQKHVVASPDVLSAWAGGAITNIVGEGTVNAIPTGAPVNGYLGDVSGQLYLIDGQAVSVPANLDSAYRTTSNVYSTDSKLVSLLPSGGVATNFIRGQTLPGVYLMDNGSKNLVPDWNTYSLWDGSRNEAQTLVPNVVLNQFPNGITITPYFTVSGANYLIDNGTYHAVNASVATAWGLTNPVNVSSAILNRFTAGSSLTTSVKVGAINYLVMGGASYGTTSSNLVDIWGLATAMPVSQTLLNLILAGGGLSPFAASTDPSDLRIFFVDKSNKLYTIQNIPEAQTLGIIGANVVKIPASSLGSYTIGTAGDLLTDGTNSYVMDGGFLRPFASSSVKNQWASNGSSDFMTVSTDITNLYPQGPSVQGAIKGTTPAVYGMSGSQKHLLSPNALSTQYGNSYSLVSDWLIGSLVSGATLL